uniref:ATP-dependent DNA helicase n=1 Tax=Tanacetum cinerariifolium TaxID=118510 RepID=A0A6L2MWB4_TANCI|nr:hypothetical protein [Tanacetum cinerariifolium]
MVRDQFKVDELDNVRLKLIGKRASDRRNYNLTASSEVYALIVRDIKNSLDKIDIVIETKTCKIKHISVLHPSFLSLQYPLFFLYGEDGYKNDVVHRGVVKPDPKKHNRLTMREYFSYIIQERKGRFSLHHNSRRLFQQLLVDDFAMIETERLWFHRRNQKTLRIESYQKLSTSVDNGNTGASKLGKRIVLPSYFTGGARYMRKNYLDTMSLCKWYGHPDFFITFTCNPKWQEITRFLNKTRLRPKDRPDVVCKVFKMRLDHLIKNLKEKKILDASMQPSVASSKFLAWMKCNETDDAAQTLTYADFPSKFVWKSKKRMWERRKQGYVVGRIHQVPPSLGEAYYLRVLLNKIKGKTSWEEIRTVDGKLYDSFRDACFAMGLLDDDKEYIEAIKEGYHISFGDFVRRLFVMLLTSNSVARPDHVWNQTWEYMSDDIKHEQRLLLKNPDLEIRERHRKNICLQYIDKLLRRNGSSLSSISGMPLPDLEFLENHPNSLIHDEICCNPDLLRAEHERLFSSITTKEKIVYIRVISAVKDNKGGVFVFYGYSGTGKTYIWKTVSAAIRSKGEIVLNVASSGIASLILTGGHTTHSQFGIPINVNEDSFCSIIAGTYLAALLITTSLIMWDEALMMHIHCFKALDRSLRDIIGSTNPKAKEMPFGGKVIVLGGDFRQILPVILGGTRQDVIHASLNSSYIWDDCMVLELTTNMRPREGSEKSNIEEIKEFGEWILKMGDGRLGGPNDGEATVKIPDDILISANVDPVASLIEFVYPSLLDNLQDPTFFNIEQFLLLLTKSSDSICEFEGVDNTYTESLYSSEVLNGLKLSGIPNHILALKVGAPVMLLRNIDQTTGLCNGTRLRILKLGEHLIESQIMTGSNVGHTTIIPRLKLSPSDKRLPLKINRRQFSVSCLFCHDHQQKPRPVFIKRWNFFA